MSLPNQEELEDFNDRVDEVARLIDGLKENRIPVDYVDKKLQDNNNKNDQKLMKKQRDAKKNEISEEQMQEIMEKVEVLKNNREKKMKARERYQDYIQNSNAQVGTDYQKWDMWCPSDEEDDLLNKCTPDNPQFKALEKDIDDRHQRIVKARQVAERCRLQGNSSYCAKQYADAYRWYCEGLDSEKHNIKLQSNAAMSSIQMQCYVQAKEHCDKVVQIAEMYLEKPDHPLLVKALFRRAICSQNLGLLKQAKEDVDKGLGIDSTCEDFLRLRTELSHTQQEQDLYKTVKQKITNKQSNTIQVIDKKENSIDADGGNGKQASCKANGGSPKSQLVAEINTESFQRLENLVQSINQQVKIVLQSQNCKIIQGINLPKRSQHFKKAAKLCDEIRDTLVTDTKLKIYLKACGGISQLVKLLDATSSVPPSTSYLEVTQQSALHVVRLACYIESNIRDVCCEVPLKSVYRLLYSDNNSVTTECLQILLACTDNKHTRSTVAQSIVAQPGFPINHVRQSATAQIQEDGKCNDSNSLGGRVSVFSRIVMLCQNENVNISQLSLSLLANCTHEQSLRKHIVQQKQNEFVDLLETTLKQDLQSKLQLVYDIIINACLSQELLQTIASRDQILKPLVGSFKSTITEQEQLQETKNQASGSCIRLLQSLTGATCNLSYNKVAANGLFENGLDSTILLQAASNLLQCNLRQVDNQQKGIKPVGVYTKSNWLVLDRYFVIIRRLTQHASGFIQCFDDEGFNFILNVLQQIFICTTSSTQENTVWQLVQAVEIYQSKNQNSRSFDKSEKLNIHGKCLMELAPLNTFNSIIQSLVATVAAFVINGRQHNQVLSIASALVSILGSSESDPQLQGNIALIISELAKKHQDCRIFKRDECIQQLTELSKSKHSAQRNAAIALSRLAQDQTVLLKLRENRVLNILYQNTKLQQN